MTGLGPFLRLVLRPSLILGVFLLGSYSVLLVAIDGAFRKALGLHGEAAVHHLWNLGGFLVPLILGYLGGQAVNEIRYTWFSWTVPRIKGKLVRGLLICGAVTAVAVTAAHLRATGTAPAAPLLCASFLWFVLGASVESSALSLTLHRRSTATLVLILVVIGSIDRLTGFYAAQPVLASALALGAAAFYGFLTYGPRTDRPRLFTPTLSLLNMLNPEAKQRFLTEAGLRKGPSPRKWTRSLATGSLGTWIRAAEYEGYGQNRGGWLVRSFIFVGILTFLIALFGFEDGFEETGSVTRGFQYVYYALFETPSHSPVEGNTPPYFVTYWMIGVLGWMFGFYAPLFLRSRFVPLSRAQRARITYWSGLTQLLLTGLLLGAGLYALGALGYFLSGREGNLLEPTFIRVLLVVLILMPLAQWLALRSRSSCEMRGSGFLISMSGIIGTAAAAAWWGHGAPRWFPNPLVEVALLAALFGISQWIWRWSVNRVYRLGDLA